MKIYLVRHGKTIANEKKLYCGKSDLSLSETGISELCELKKKIAYPACDRYFTSGAKRANETFEILYPDKGYETLENFWEYDFGDFEMKSYDMLKENQEYINWISDKDGRVSCPSGESKIEYRKRVKEAFIQLVNKSFERNIKSVVLLSHGGTIGTILELFYDDSKSFYEYQPACGQGYEIGISESEENEIIIEYVKNI